MKICLREKCKKEFEPNKPKQVFCSDKCRVYNSRENKSPSEKTPSKPKPIKKQEQETKSEKPSTTGLTSFQIYQRKKLGIK